MPENASICRREFWHLRRKPALVFSKWVFFKMLWSFNEASDYIYPISIREGGGRADWDYAHKISLSPPRYLTFRWPCNLLIYQKALVPHNGAMFFIEIVIAIERFLTHLQLIIDPWHFLQISGRWSSPFFLQSHKRVRPIVCHTL